MRARIAKAMLNPAGVDPGTRIRGHLWWTDIWFNLGGSDSKIKSLLI